MFFMCPTNILEEWRQYYHQDFMTLVLADVSICDVLKISRERVFTVM